MLRLNIAQSKGELNPLWSYVKLDFEPQNEVLYLLENAAILLVFHQALEQSIILDPKFQVASKPNDVS